VSALEHATTIANTKIRVNTWVRTYDGGINRTQIEIVKSLEAMTINTYNPDIHHRRRVRVKEYDAG
jgi:hypothetical protein